MLSMSSLYRNVLLIGICFAISVTSLLVLYLPDTESQAREPYVRIQKLLATQSTILGQPIMYPTGEPSKILAVIVALKPGEETGWHTHGVPLFGYMMEGELTVDYGEHGEKIYKTGDSFIEAIKTAHNGKSTGAGPVRILAVFMGAEGVMNTTKIEESK